MNLLISKIPQKAFISYILLCLLSFTVGVIFYAEFQKYLKLTENNTADQNKIFKIGNIISLMYKNESVSKYTIQSNAQSSYKQYLLNNDELFTEIDSLKVVYSSEQQIKLLDSVKHLIAQKEENISAIKTLKTNNETYESVDDAILQLSQMKSSLEDYSLKDFVSNPNALHPETRKALEEYIATLNQLTSQSENLNKQSINAILNASTNILKKLKLNSGDQLSSASIEKNKLLAKDLLISRQIQEILSKIERDTIQEYTNVSSSRKTAIKKSQNRLVSASIIGVIMIILFIIIILNDFLKIQKFKKELELSSSYTNTLLKSREHLIKMVSHDLRSPLSNILGYSDLLQTSTTKTKRDSYIDKIKNASSYMIRLVEDLLDYSKLEAGKIKPKNNDFNLSLLINEVSQSVKQQHSHKPIQLGINIDNALNQNIISDSHRIRQILNNLISNAFKYTEEGFVKINAYINDLNEIIITVKDSGVGIKKEKHDLIFNEFTQIEEQDEVTQNGFGLGLTITKKLVEILQGELSFESQENFGSIFTVKIPVSLSEKKVPESIFINNEANKPISKTQKSNLKAIVIEDDNPLRILIEEIFNTAGIKVKSFKSGDEALKAINNSSFDFITTDIQIPHMSGFDIM
ncbi:ATP-binding response regulator [Zhouia amylolytica]|uniref:ATP-binding response regulator n=1 Tax=Zhouia amylolytica TaxID=376730 RepID=UPI0009456666|nr:hybrid sensor histidine kinase/response regulator [Zhouia amylolytica]